MTTKLLIVAPFNSGLCINNYNASLNSNDIFAIDMNLSEDFFDTQLRAFYNQPPEKKHYEKTISHNNEVSNILKNI